MRSKKAMRLMKEAGKIKDNAIVEANQLSADAANKTKEIKESIAPEQAPAQQAPAGQQ